MVAQAGSYSIEDVMPFTAEVYQRLAERQIETFAPGQFVGLLLGIAAVALVARGYFRSVAIVLAVVWTWVAITFHFRLFAELTWLANYIGGAFIAQAILLLVIAWWGGFDLKIENRRSRIVLAAGYLPIALGVAVYPLLGVIGSAGAQPQWFAMTPDPTAVATLGLLILASRPAYWALLMPIPFAWAALSIVIRSSLELPADWLMVAAVGLAVLAAIWLAVAAVGDYAKSDTDEPPSL